MASMIASSFSGVGDKIMAHFNGIGARIRSAIGNIPLVGNLIKSNANELMISASGLPDMDMLQSRAVQFNSDFTSPFSRATSTESQMLNNFINNAKNGYTNGSGVSTDNINTIVKLLMQMVQSQSNSQPTPIIIQNAYMNSENDVLKLAEAIEKEKEKRERSRGYIKF